MDQNSEHLKDLGTSDMSLDSNPFINPTEMPNFDFSNPNGTSELPKDKFKAFKAAEKMAENQIKQPGMDIDSVEIVPRLMWNAVEPKLKIPLTKPITAVLATFTGTKPCYDDVDCKRIIQNLQTTQMEHLNLPDIQWNYMIGGTSKVYEGRGVDTLATKPPHYDKEALNSLDFANCYMIGGTGKVYEGRGVDTLATKPPHYDKEALNSLDIAYIGNNDIEDMKPIMFATLNGLIAWAMDAGHVTKPFAYLQDSPQYRKIMRLQ